MDDQHTATQRRGLKWLTRKIAKNWLKRHQHPASLALHAIGVPMTLCGLLLPFWDEWTWAFVLFTGGYALQFLGHAIEGNDAGEWIVVKKLFGRPYVDVATRWQTVQTTNHS